jgi:hypothetical protein
VSRHSEPALLPRLSGDAARRNGGAPQSDPASLPERLFVSVAVAVCVVVWGFGIWKLAELIAP